MNLIQAIEADVVQEWGKIETLVVDETKAVWNTVKAAWFALTPAQWQDVIKLLENEAASFIGHDYAGMVQNLVMWGETKGLPWLATVEENVLVSIIATWKVSTKAT